MAWRHDFGVRDFLLSTVVRPLLFVFWSLVLWGTCYGLVLAVAIVREGPSAAIQRALSGHDAIAGQVNLALVGLAVIVWILVAMAVRAHRRARAAADAAREGS